MLDIKCLRENPEIVKENIRKKFQDSKLPLVDEVIALDAENRKTQQEADALRADRNRISKEICVFMAHGQKAEAEEAKQQEIIICRKENKYVIEYCSDNRIIAREYELV